MTEQTGAYSAEPAPFLPGGDADGPDTGRRKTLVVAAGLAVVLALVAVFFLLKGGGSSGAEASGVVPHGKPPASADGKKHPARDTHKAVTLPKDFKGHVGRDPFNPLYVAPVAAPATPTDTGAGSTGSTPNAGSGGGSSTGSGTGASPAPVPSAPPADPGTGSGSGSGSGGTAAYQPVWIELVKVHGTRSATFVVGYSNGTHTRTRTFDNVAVPTSTTFTRFASNFALLSVQSGTATVKYGDATPFDLAPGYGFRHYVG